MKKTPKPGDTFLDCEGKQSYTIVRTVSSNKYFVGPKWFPAVKTEKFVDLDQKPNYVFKQEEMGEIQYAS